MRTNARLFMSLLALAAIATAPQILQADSVIEEIVARVNNQIVTRSDFLRSKEQLKQEAQQDAANAERVIAERQKDILRDLIDQQLLLERGKDLDINVDTEVIKELDEMRKKMGLESMEDLEKAAQGQGVSFEDYKQNMKNGIIMQRVIRGEVGSHIPIAKEEEQKFYDDHKADMQRPEEVRLSEILVATQKMGADGKTVIESDEVGKAAAEAKAKDLLEQIRKGAAFEDVAKKSSDGPSAAQGGDLGYFQRGTLAKDLEEKTFALKPGETTDVVRTKQGFVILKSVEHHDAGVPALKDIEGRVQEAIYNQKLQPALRTFLTKLREDAFIEIKPGYIDTGASPNQTKFIQTNAPDLTAKELKSRRKKKFGVL